MGLSGVLGALAGAVWLMMIQTTISSPRICDPKQSMCGTLLGTNISFSQGRFEDDFAFPKVGYISSLEGVSYLPTFTKKIMKQT